MRWLIPIGFFCLIYIEVSIFVTVVNRIGVFSSLLAIFFTCLIGISLVKQSGVRNAQQMKQKLAMGETPTPEITKNISLIFSAILFIIPGFFTSFIAALLLLPIIQNTIIKRFVKHAKLNGTYKRKPSRNNGQSSITIEGEYAEKTSLHSDDENIDK